LSMSITIITTTIQNILQNRQNGRRDLHSRQNHQNPAKWVNVRKSMVGIVAGTLGV
jgi:hypothetical protein